MHTRDYKHCGPGEYYHIYNRGNAQANIFREDSDYKFFILRLRQNIKPDGREGKLFKPLPTGAFSLIAYCLMPNHFHLLLRQNDDIPTSKLLGKICTSYSMYFNRKYQRAGHVFQDQFKQKNIDNNEYFLGLSAYIHLNPVKACMVRNAEEYPWSSIHEFTGQGDKGGIVDAEIILKQFEPRDYKNYLQEVITSEANSYVVEDLLFD